MTLRQFIQICAEVCSLSEAEMLQQFDDLDADRLLRLIYDNEYRFNRTWTDSGIEGERTFSGREWYCTSYVADDFYIRCARWYDGEKAVEELTFNTIKDDKIIYSYERIIPLITFYE